MDEILASIRRIIESGDERPGVASGGSAASAGHPTGGAAGVETKPTPSDFSLRHPPIADEPDAGIADDDLRALSEVEIDIDDGRAPEAYVETDRSDAAQGPAGAEADPGEAWDDAQPEAADEPDERSFAASPPPVAENENAMREPSDEEDSSDVAAAASRNFSFEFDDEAFEAALRSDAWHATVTAYAPANEPGPPPGSEVEPEPDPSEVRPAKAEMPESVIEGASALLSAQAGDQVAAAFDSLTHAIRDGQMRSMEDMAREMLRPMLREWLDDNLPRLVERLVRDEIERIARGPRR